MASYVIPIIVLLMSLIFGAGAIAFIIVFIKSHRLRLRNVVNGKKYIEDYWMMEHKDKTTGDIYWKSVFFQKSIKTELPPNTIRDVGKKGKFYAELYVTGTSADGTIEGIWMKDNMDEADDKLKLSNGELVKDVLKPFSVTQRAFATRQFKKAEERRANKWDIQKIANIAFLGLFMIVLIIGIIYAPDILENQAKVEGAKVEWMKKANEITDRQLAITNAMGVKVENWDVVVSQSVKQKPNSVITTSNELQPMGE